MRVDVDLSFPCDGFTIITLSWIENTGWCGPGEPGAFIDDNWDRKVARILDGRIHVNPHGSALSEGGTPGSGHLRQAIVPRRGDAGPPGPVGEDRAPQPRKPLLQRAGTRSSNRLTARRLENGTAEDLGSLRRLALPRTRRPVAADPAAQAGRAHAPQRADC